MYPLTYLALGNLKKLPLEVRCLLWEHYMVHKGILTPAPTERELEMLRTQGNYITVVETQLPTSDNFRVGDTKYQTSLPCVALLAVNKRIRWEILQVYVG